MGTTRADGYARRAPEETLLYRVVREHWPTFRELAEERGGLPDFVTREFEEYLRCGILEHGLVHLCCERCGHAMVVAFSCKRRGFCPSCTARRMSDVAAHLVEEVLPDVPIRQWVCSLPWRLRTALAYDKDLCADVIDAFISSLTRSLRRRAKKHLGLRSMEDALTGAVTFIQRSDSALRLNVHAHTLSMDGVYVRDAAGVLVFHALPAPTVEDIQDVVRRTHAALTLVLARHGRSLDGMEEDVFASEEPALASCAGASAADLVLFGERAGQRTSKLGRALGLVSSESNGSYAELEGVNIHAGAVIDGRDRKRLERVCRYIARPPLALERLEEHGEGRLRYCFKKPWKDGTDAVLLAPLDLIARLAALVPPPRFHMLRYHGVLAANAKVRAEVVPKKPVRTGVQLPLFMPGEEGYLAPPPEPSRHPWPWLLARVFAVDITACPKCTGRMRVIEVAQDEEDAARVLSELGMSARAPPPRASARRVHPYQLSLSFAG